ncbi:glycosyltransferase involved in cell wall biosynthesis [Desulfofundulus luciae]|uniref:Glycosyltransferase involved in cell wall biosynthesis n=1 Tax=Desulfofundulus luciae TaxID=74702 RepID=A0ABU0AYK0_9FIRM|nr:glycosyltransferase [Desulfofundulus luciae]MDQ0285553.1 glycosyltransferase involved in cell wall biosynthesis [Desulfofundulus luciae]
MVRVSIGLPFFNSESTLPLALHSVFAQTYQEWELILVDDGSKDGSLEIAHSIQDERVRVISDGENQGLAYRLNQIAELAKGDFLARMDADDIMHPSRLKTQVEFLLAYPEIDVLGTAAYVIDHKNRVVGIRSSSPGVEPAMVLKRTPFIHPTVMAKRTWFLKHPYNPRFKRSQDRELWCRAIRDSRFEVLDTPLHFYREVGVFSLEKYLSSVSADIEIIRHYGRALVGPIKTAQLILFTRLKGEAYRVASLLNAEKVLLKLRSSTPSLDQRVTAEEALKIVFKTPVPGLSKGVEIDHVLG